MAKSYDNERYFVIPNDLEEAILGDDGVCWDVVVGPIVFPIQFVV